MTCIVGVERNGKVWIGGDSQGTAGWHKTERSDEKVFRSGHYLYGFTSSYRMGQLLRFGLQVPDQAAGQADDLKHMCTVFIDALRQCFKEGGYARVENNQESGGTFLVGYRGRLYSVHSDFQVARSALGYCAAGSGEEFALGALSATVEMKPRRRIETALTVASMHSAACGGPYVIESIHHRDH